jgi:hypothetical protein
MVIPTTRTPTLEKIDISMFVHSARALNEKASHLIKALAGDHESATEPGGLELLAALDELKFTLKTLRRAVEGAPPMSGALHALTGDGAKGASRDVVLDTTEEMVRVGHLVTPLEFQVQMGWKTRQAVWKALAGHRVFCLTHKSERFFPVFYSDPSLERKDLEAVSKTLGCLPGGVKLQFFLTHKGSLGGKSPLRALAEGRLTKVLDVAKAFAEDPNK